MPHSVPQHMNPVKAFAALYWPTMLRAIDAAVAYFQIARCSPLRQDQVTLQPDVGLSPLARCKLPMRTFAILPYARFGPISKRGW
jgi:hypothetical protein